MSISAMFMFRGVVEGLPDNMKEDFVDTDPKCVDKVKMMKDMIKTKFPVCINKIFSIF